VKKLGEKKMPRYPPSKGERGGKRNHDESKFEGERNGSLSRPSEEAARGKLFLAGEGKKKKSEKG